MLSAQGLYHTGVIVRDLDAAMSDLTEATGVRWRTPGQMVVPVWVRGEEREVDFRAVYSLDGPHHLELVQHAPDTIWTCSGDGAVHHVGYWSEDLGATADRLERSGFTRVAASTMGGDDLVFTYHQRGSGPFIEHVSTSIRHLVFG